jgi:FtsH-binding integral membrane protein
MLIMRRNLLGCGLAAGPLFIAASLTQAFTRKGFDLARHPISLLSLGAPGWVQIANFVVCGILYVLGAVGLRQAIRQSRGGTWGSLLIGIIGVGLIIAGVFTADPGAGFPPGAPSGAPTMSWHGLLHEFGFLLTFVAAISASVVFTRRYAAQGRRGWMVAALMTPVAALVVAGWPDINTLSVRLVITTAILFGFLTSVFADVLKQGRIDQEVEEEDHRRSRDQRPARH